MCNYCEPAMHNVPLGSELRQTSQSPIGNLSLLSQNFSERDQYGGVTKNGELKGSGTLSKNPLVDFQLMFAFFKPRDELSRGVH